MKFCPDCGTQLADNAEFCSRCGTRIEKSYSPPVRNVNTVPVQNTYSAGLKTNRGLLKFILFTILTFGIYSIVVNSQVVNDLNTIASKYDGRKTTHYCLVLFVLSWLTLGIYPLIWRHLMSERIGVELRRRKIDYSFGAIDFWLWNIVGCLIIVGPFIYLHKLLKSMNLLAADYNLKG